MAFKDMKDDLESLEYGKILAQIKSHASSEYGQRYLETHLPSSDIQQVEKWLKETEEAWELVRKNVDPFTFFVSDVDAVVDLLNKQGYVPVEDFLNFVKAADVLVQLRRKLSAETGVLGSLAKRIVPLDAWLNDVRSKVDESGFVKDDASRKLSDIRRDQKRLSNEIQDKLQREMDRYQRFISDRLVVKRGNRYAIPVKSSNVPQVKGIVLDWSGSGQTAYVEPFSVVDMNNRLEELRFMEEQEIYRIFQELCSQLGVALAEPEPLPWGKGELLREGDDLLIVAAGTVANAALRAAEKLFWRGIKAAVINARFVKPLDEELILNWARRCPRVITVEENILAGGFGSAIMELLQQEGLSRPVKCLGIQDRFVEQGSRQELLTRYGLDSEGIYRAASRFLQEQKVERSL